MHFGIDFGSKKAGTTAICFDEGNLLILMNSEKNKDADMFLKSHIKALRPEMIFMDAPLSLPAAYYNKGDNFHYRDCDVVTKAMSPMFLGGLTARAISLTRDLSEFKFQETYPALLVRTIFDNQEFYKKKEALSAKAIEILETKLNKKFSSKPNSWHQFDAVLAWLSGYRYIQGSSLSFGNKSEGIIII